MYSIHPQKATRTKPRADLVLDLIFSVPGGGARTSEACGVSRQAVSQWAKVPARHLETVGKLFGLVPVLIRKH